MTEASQRTDPQIAIMSHLRPDENGEAIEVRISYEIIKLFSEGLYQSPHKALEELSPTHLMQTRSKCLS